VKCPVQIVQSELFHPDMPLEHYPDSWETVKQTMAHATNQAQRENIVVNKIAHQNQVDQTVLIGWDICIIYGDWPKTYLAEVYLLHSKLWLTFMDKLDDKKQGDAYFDPTEAKEYVRRLSQKWLSYDIAYSS